VLSAGRPKDTFVTASTNNRVLELLSVCAPVYNEEALLEQFYARASAALEQAAAREQFDYELIIVDDGSRDSRRSSIASPRATRGCASFTSRATSATRLR
jgi:hypothetical protein